MFSDRLEKIYSRYIQYPEHVRLFLRRYDFIVKCKTAEAIAISSANVDFCLQL